MMEQNPPSPQSKPSRALSLRNALFPIISAEAAGEIRWVLPFFWMLTAAMVFLYGVTVYNQPELFSSGRFLPFTVIMLLYTLLHWYSPRFVSSGGKWIWIYFLIQSAIAFSLITLTGSETLAYGLYMPLLGEAIGIIETVWQKGVAVVAITALSGLSLYLLNENYIGWGWLITVAPITTFVIIYVWLFRKQVDARQQAQQYLEELEHANRQLAEYADRIEDLTLVSERQRMARELHDTLAQGLAGLILQLEAADSHLSSGRSDRAQTIVQQAMGRARNTLGEARKVIDDLRAGPATAGGLAEALEKEVQRFISASGISCDLKLNLPPTLPDEISEHLLRMVAEGLVNVERHARASRAWVRVEYSSGNLNIEVGDDGIGFDPQLTLQRPGHYGLLGMRERARLAGGAMQIRSKPGEGATIEMRLPLNSPAEPGEPTKLPTWQGNKKHES